jgi:hypothetical protein
MKGNVTKKWDTLFESVREENESHFVRIIRGSTRLSFWDNSMEQSPSWKAKSFSARNENSLILLDRKVHHRVHNSEPRVPILSQIHPLKSSNLPAFGYDNF